MSAPRATPAGTNRRSNAICVVPKPFTVIGICMTSRITGMNAK